MTTASSTTAFTLNIPTDIVSEVTDALCKAGGFEVVSEANAKQTAINWIITTVQNVQQAAALAAVAPAPVTPITGLS